MPAATACVDSVTGAGDLRARYRYATTCRTASPEPTAKVSASKEAPDGSTSEGGADEPKDSADPQPEEPGPVIPGITPPSASLAVGEKSSAGAGTYVLWIKAENRVYIVVNGVVKRVMLTTSEPWKTPVGDYKITDKMRHAASTEDGIHWYIPKFLAFYQRPGAVGRIGFHEIPWDEKTKKRAQPVNTLGMPGYSSHGCARLAPKDAEALYSFAHEGTKVKVR
ncbi:MAG: L,D-transpeptidase [Cutibacterium sp.]|nr:L,D-transpeptidase [Cutibacterium sp.]MDO4412496.1 L,D-transpeptidase [Cutibacterium sp.]